MSKELITTVSIILAAGIVIAGILAVLGQAPETGDAARTISVQGTATQAVAPDEAVISFSVVTEADSAQQAAEENSQQMQAVLDVLAPLGDVESDYYSVNPVYDYSRDESTPRIQFYRATNSVQVTTTNLQSVGDVIDAGIGAGANRVSSVSFQLTDARQDALRAQMLADAGLNAQDKAESIASGLSLRLGEVHSVSESSVSFPVYRGASDESFSTKIQPGDLDVSASVMVSYEIR